MKPGSPRQCLCQGQLHKLLNNCLACGLILCIEDKNESNSCPFCGTKLDFTPDISSLMDQSAHSRGAYGSTRESFIKLNAKLVEADMQSARLNTVIDDVSSDFFLNQHSAKYTPWSSIEEQRAEHELWQQKVLQEMEEKRKISLANALDI